MSRVESDRAERHGLSSIGPDARLSRDLDKHRGTSDDAVADDGSLRYVERTDDVGRFLLLAARGERTTPEIDELVSLYARLGAARCQAAAERNKVIALIGDALMRTPGIDLAPQWEATVATNAAKKDDLVASLRAVVLRLDRAGIRHAVVESGGVALGTDLPLRALGSSDMDVIVDAGSLPRALEAFAAEGFHASARDGRARTARVEVRRPESSRRGEQWLEVGSVPFDRAWVPLRFANRMDVWLSRAVPSRKFSDLRVLAPADALAFVAMHTSLHSWVRSPGLRLHVDVDRLARDTAPDWNAVVAEVLALGVPTRAALSFIMARDLLGAPIPRAVVEALLCQRSARARAALTLLERERVLSNGHPKLRGAATALLDALVDERSLVSWLRSIAAPPEEWMRDHFDASEAAVRWPLWRLHAERVRALAERWRPT